MRGGTGTSTVFEHPHSMASDSSSGQPAYLLIAPSLGKLVEVTLHQAPAKVCENCALCRSLSGQGLLDQRLELPAVLYLDRQRHRGHHLLVALDVGCEFRAVEHLARGAKARLRGTAVCIDEGFPQSVGA